MSWIGGEFVLNDVTKKDLDAAADRIRYAVRSNANLAEFPNMGSRINPFKHICPQIIFNGYEEAEEILERKRSEWSRNYTGYVAFRDLESTNKTKRIIELKEKIESETEKKIRYGLDNNVKTRKQITLAAVNVVQRSIRPTFRQTDVRSAALIFVRTLSKNVWLVIRKRSIS